jgi:cytidine deaminase
MIRREIKISYQEYKNTDELPVVYAGLLTEARRMAGQAYAPYSGFCVGAAVLLENNVIVTGNNQENAAYPSGLCAERTALFYANANYPDIPVEAIAISAKNQDGIIKESVKPCGGCRQVMLETETRFNKQIKIILEGEHSILLLDGVDTLLPLSFKPSALK